MVITMPVCPLVEINVDDSDIDEVEKLLGDVVFDESRRNIIKNLDTIDIQAFPGSGKTTILVAKLAILAKKWPYANKGICVLSHTNVAREEIEARLGSTEVGRKLLTYPHYIGTLHSFFDTFIGLPWLRSCGYKITAIDTEVALTRRWGKLSYGTKSYLERKSLSAFACEAKDYPILLDVKCSNTAASYIDVENCVKESFSNGYFTFDEMLYIARYALRQLTPLPHSIQTRFPVVLVDEAQDTSALQWEIIDAAFPDKSFWIINSFGDCNQAIFQSYIGQEQNDMFPRGTVLTVENSKRFGSKIAQLVNPLTLSQDGMTGECDTFAKNDLNHTIFLFDRKDAPCILPAYAKHLIKCFTDDEIQENEKSGCHAVGMVHKKEMTAEADPHFPASIADYWNQYNPLMSGRTPNPRQLVEFFRIGRSLFAQTRDMGGLVEWTAKGLRRYINMYSNVHLFASSNALNSLLAQLPVDKHNCFRSSFKQIISLPISTEAEWNLVVDKIHEHIDTQFGITAFGDDIFMWTVPNDYDRTEIGPVKNNCYHHIDAETGRTVDIHLGSIHSVKGRTHLATLAMETFWYNHNVSSILPWLRAEPPKKKCGARDGMRLKCHYVALTRAKGLVCVALPKDLVNENDITKLQQVGWNIAWI